jgi:hypothetical protein
LTVDQRASCNLPMKTSELKAFGVDQTLGLR